MWLEHDASANTPPLQYTAQHSTAQHSTGQQHMSGCKPRSLDQSRMRNDGARVRITSSSVLHQACSNVQSIDGSAPPCDAQISMHQ
jgi:hypothetical protein